MKKIKVKQIPRPRAPRQSMNERVDSTEQEKPGNPISGGNHRFAPDFIEEGAEQHGAEETTNKRKGKQGTVADRSVAFSVAFKATRGAICFYSPRAVQIDIRMKEKAGSGVAATSLCFSPPLRDSRGQPR